MRLGGIAHNFWGLIGSVVAAVLPTTREIFEPTVGLYGAIGRNCQGVNAVLGKTSSLARVSDMATIVGWTKTMSYTLGESILSYTLGGSIFATMIESSESKTKTAARSSGHSLGPNAFTKTHLLRARMTG
jgi:hypothetical protein